MGDSALAQQQAQAVGLLAAQSKAYEPRRVETEWEQSNECGDLFKALVAAQAVIKNASRDAENPFFTKPGRKAAYSTLAMIWDVCREPLTKNGLCVIQQPFTRGAQVGLRTMLAHTSGQWMACSALVTPKAQGPQEYGSVTSYLRRYALQAFAGVASEDDDGEKAEGRDRDAKPPGANWGRNEGTRSAPKASSPATSRGASSNSNSTRPTTTATPTGATSADTGEVLDAGQLVELSEAFEDKWGKAKFGTADVANLTKAQATEALGALLDWAS